MELQSIGADLGRGFAKGYSIFKNKEKSCLFQSTVGDAREIDYKDYDNPIHLEVNGEQYFAGLLAEKESYNCINNYSDDKTSDVCQKLVYALLNELAESEFVNICIGVPNKQFNKEMAEKVSNTYSGKKIVIQDKVKHSTKVVNIVRAYIFRESDAALFHVVNTHPLRAQLQNQKLGMITLGFRTSEKSFFDIGMKYVDRLSDTMEVGNRTVLDIIQKTLSKKGITKTLNEIDNDKSYDDLKQTGYKNLTERINQDIEMSWINWQEMKIFIAGGTSRKLKDIPGKFIRVEDPQMVTAKGLYFVAEKRG